MKTAIGKYGVVMGAVLIAGCATVEPYAPQVLSTRHVVDRSYTVGKEQSASVGDAIVKVKDYYVKNSSSTAVRADMAFTLRAPPLAQFDIPQGTAATVIGKTVDSGVAYRLVVLPQFPAVSFLLRDDGTFHGSGLNRGGAHMGWTYTTVPSNARFVPDASDVVETSRGYTNFELVYGGATGDSIQVLYREYTQNDLARPAFSQQLVYSKASKRFRFKNVQVEVKEANNERMVYTVTADGLASDTK